MATSASLASAMASEATRLNPHNFFPSTFFGTKRRQRAVLVFQGAIHGCEFEGTVVGLNLLNVLETGRDLRGKPWPTLQREGSTLRTLVIPFASPDGREHAPVRHLINASPELTEWITNGTWKDGKPLKYPSHKAHWPLPTAQIGHIGGYFNDHGVNLEYDWIHPDPQPETVALKRFYLEERPDAVLLSHTNAGSWVETPPPTIPDAFQHQVQRLSGQVRGRLVREGFGFPRFSWIHEPEWSGPMLTQGAGVYHLCGALPFVVEFPCGSRPRPFTFEQILDAGLTVMEEIYSFANRDGFRPLEYWEKVKAQLEKELARS